MWFLQAIGVGFAFTLGMELALGLHHAIKMVMRGNKK
jgi:hypothetical protein